MSKPWAERFAEKIPDGLYRALVRRDGFCFFYHVVSDETLAHIAPLYSYKTPHQFECDLLYLKQNYELISYGQLASLRAGQASSGRPFAFLSFDDGCSECFSVVRPLLLKHGIPCTFFITTSLIGNRKMLYRHVVALCLRAVKEASDLERASMLREINREFQQNLDGEQAFRSWIRSFKREEPSVTSRLCQLLEIDVDAYLKTRRPYLAAGQIQTLALDGFTIGAHSQSHSKMQLLDEPSIEAEMADSCQEIRAITQQEQVPFAFPFSASGVSRDLLARITQQHPSIGLLFDTKGIRLDRPFILNRIWSDPPPDTSSDPSNLPQLLRDAYEDIFLWNMRRLRLYSWAKI